MICTCPTTRAYPRPGAAHVPRGRLPAQRLRRVFGAHLSQLARFSHCRVATQGSGPDMRLSSGVPRRVLPTRANGVCAVPLLRGRTSFSLTALLRAVEPILARLGVPGPLPRPGCQVQEPAVHCQCLSSECRTHTVLGLPGHPALVTLDSLFAFARPAPLPVACLSFGFVDNDLPDSRCRRCCQSVAPARPPLARLSLPRGNPRFSS